MQNQIVQAPIPNFRQVTDWLYRGGQPSMDEFRVLKEELGIKTVINLRWRKGPIVREQARVRELGMNFFHISLNYWTLPNMNNVDEFLKLADDESLRPMFVHCLHGADRTGVLIAMFRIMRCGWSLEQAFREMLNCGHHRFRTRHFKYALWRLAEQVASQNRQIGL